MGIPGTGPRELIRLSFGGKVRPYEMREWKRAITSFLEHIWSKHPDDFGVGGAILFGDVGLSIGSGRGSSYRMPLSTIKECSRPSFAREDIHAVTCERDEVELGLARFVHNSGIKMLVIEFASVRFMLWKGPEKTSLNYTVAPRTF